MDGSTFFVFNIGSRLEPRMQTTVVPDTNQGFNMIKKTLLLLIALAMSLSHAWAYSFSAVSPSGHTLYYNYGSNGSSGVGVTRPGSSLWDGYTKPTGAVIIPSSVTYNGVTYLVTEIGYSAFRSCDGISSVTIPNTVACIDAEAFYGCSGLTNISIPSSVTSIGNNAFYSCTSLSGVTIPNSVTSIGSYAFWGCSSLTNVVIPNSITTIPSYCFSNCSGLTNVTIPNSVTSINQYAFSGCSSSGCITIPNSVTSIGSGAFSQVNKIQYAGSALGRPWGAATATYGYEEDFLTYSDSTKRTIVRCDPNASFVTIPSSVRTIDAYAFQNCSNLSSIQIPNGVTSIGASAFQGCSSLVVVSIGNGVSKIGDRAFYNCTGIISLTIGTSVDTIGSYAFYNCYGLQTLSLPNSTTRIEDNAFYSCSGLRRIIIPDNVTFIGPDAFRYCSNATSIHIGAAVQNIGNTSFYGCSRVDTIFYNAIACANAGYSTNSGDGFKALSSLDVVFFGGDVVSIPAHAFYGCSYLHTIVIPSQVTAFGASAFANCSNLVNVHFEAENPPAIPSTLFSSNSNRKFRVPCASVDSYKSSVFWYNYRHQIYPSVNCQYIVTLSTPNTELGTLTGSGSYIVDSVATIQANPTTGYSFVTWNDGITTNPRSITVKRDTSFVATFVIDTFDVNAIPNSMSLGSVTGSGHYTYGTTITMSATPAEHCHFAQWDDGVTMNPRIITVDRTITYTAIFELDTFNIVVSSQDAEKGSASYSMQSGNSRVHVGAGTNSGYYAPFNNYYCYSTNESLYLSSEIGQSGMIDTLWYNCLFATTHSYTSLKIYMGTTTATSLSSGWVGLNNLQLVYSKNQGSIASNTGWEAFPLSAPFNYNGTENLIIVVCRTAPSWNSAQYAYSTVSNMCRYRQSDGTQSDGTLSGTGTGILSSNRANIRLSMPGVSSGSAPVYLAPITLNATANNGYHFTQWNDGDTLNPRQITVENDSLFIAQFGANDYLISAQANDTNRGYVQGSGYYSFGTSADLIPIANPHYHFLGWSDGSSDNPRSVDVVNDALYTSVFVADTYQLNVVCSNPSMGNVSGGGIYQYTGSSSYIGATASNGYHFVQWNDGATQNPRSLVLCSDTAFSAIFAANSYQITAISNDTTKGSVTGSNSYLYGGVATLTANALPHYHFTGWNDGNTAILVR